MSSLIFPLLSVNFTTKIGGELAICARDAISVSVHFM